MTLIKEPAQNPVAKPPKTGPLRHILSKVQTLQRLNQGLAKVIDPELTQYCQVANFSDNNLVIAVANATWLTRLRFLETTLIDELRRQPLLHDLQNIEWKVQLPDHPTEPTTHTNKLTLSAANSQLLTNTAETIQSETLKAALLRLAEHGQ